MAAGTYQVAAQKMERFPTEWALYDGNESECGQELRQSEDGRPGGWVPVSASEALGSPAGQSARLGRQTRGAV